MPRLKAYPIVKIILVVVQLAKLSMKKKRKEKAIMNTTYSVQKVHINSQEKKKQKMQQHLQIFQNH